jgi:hypothetical protein
MQLALIPQQYDYNPQEICGSPILEYIEVNIQDFLLINAPTLRNKIENNSKRAAWLKGCVCKPKPSNPDPPPPIEPDPEPDPANPPSIPPQPTCNDSDYGTSNWLIWRVLNPTANAWEWFRLEITLPLDSFGISILYKIEGEVSSIWRSMEEIDNPDGLPLIRLWLLYYTTLDGNEVLQTQSTNGISSPYILECSGFPDPTEPDPTTPDWIDPCTLFGCGGGGDCLKLPDRAFIISELKLWISESNDRIRDEIIDAISAKTSLDKGDIAGYITTAKNSINENIEFTQSIIVSRYEALRTVLDDLQPYIDGAKNQILTALAALSAALAAGLTAVVATITAAITASTTAITTAITATQTALSNLINSVKGDIERKVEVEGEKNNYKRLIVRVSIQSFPTNSSVTNGRDGSPDRIAFGWLMFYRTMPNGTKFYFERRFINFVRCSFISEGSAENIGYVIHFFPSVVGLAESEITRFRDNG